MEIPKKRIAIVENIGFMVDYYGDTVENCGNMGWHHFSNASHHRPDSKYIMLKNCGNTIFYAVDPAVKE